MLNHAPRLSSHIVTRAIVLGSALLFASHAFAASTLSPADQSFVAKVSQGGMFEVASSKLAVEKAQAQDIKDMANTEVHDHTLVGDKLAAIASKNGDSFPTELNADFTQRMKDLQALSGTAFDTAYAAQMKRIHAIDGAAFAKEAKTAQNADLKAFAAETAGIVKMHIGSWQTVR